MIAETSPAVDALVQISFAVTSALMACAAEDGLSLTQLRLLGILRDRTPTMAAIASRLDLDRSSVSGLIDRAEKRGLVARRSSPGDGREVIVELTGEGGAVAVRVAARVQQEIAALLQGTTSGQRDMLIDLAAQQQPGSRNSV